MSGARENANRVGSDGESKLRALLDAIRELSGELELDSLLKRAMEVSTRLVDADRSSLFIFDRATDELWSKIAQGLDTVSLRFSASKGLAGAAVKSGEIVNVPDAYEDERFNREFDEKTGYRTRSVLCVPMKATRGRSLGVIQVLNRAGGKAFDREDEKMLEALGSHVAEFIENAQLYESIETLFESFVSAASMAIEERDPATSGHSKRVAKYAVGLARAAHDTDISRFTRSRLRQLRYASLLHDFGKIGVRECVLTKRGKLSDDRLACVEERFRNIEHTRGAPGSMTDAAELVRRANDPGFLSDDDAASIRELGRAKALTDGEVECLCVRRGNLTAAEWVDMRSHSERSRNILSRIPWPEEYACVPEIAHRHHEKLDGSGYPRGIAGDEIDVDARILGIVDIYDALTAEDRPYKRAMPREKAQRILEEEAAAGRLDAGLVKLFFERRLHEAALPGQTQVMMHVS